MRGYTEFEITKFELPKDNDVDKIYHVYLKEVSEDVRGQKVLLWVDHNPLIIIVFEQHMKKYQLPLYIWIQLQKLSII